MKAQKFISWNMVHGFDKILTAWNPVHTALYKQQVTRTHCMEFGRVSHSLYETWKMELDTGSYLLHTAIEQVLASLNTGQTTHYMQHVTKYSLHGKLDT
jgi:hypothetical protein